MYDVFLSYARDETAEANRLKSALEAAGLNVFCDVENIDGGAEFPEAVDTALRSSAAVIGCWSPHYFTRRWCLIESRFAAGETPSKLVPVAIRKLHRDTTPTDFLHTNYHDLTSWRGRTDDTAWKATLRSLEPMVRKTLVFDAPSEKKAARKQTASGLDETMMRAAQAARSDGPIKERAFQIVSRKIPNWPSPQMVAVPPGKYEMGDYQKPENAYALGRIPSHEVEIRYCFALGKYPVTVAEWQCFKRSDGLLGGSPRQRNAQPRHPVTDISFRQIEKFITWLNRKTGLHGRPDCYRLPTEAEWEYACRAGTIETFSFGWTLLHKQACFDKRKELKTDWFGGIELGLMGEPPTGPETVGLYPSNAFGLHDMHGGVWEICADYVNMDYVGAPTDGSAWLTGDRSRRIIRGGAWNSLPDSLASSKRLAFDVNNSDDSTGFRLARTLPA